MSQQPVTAIAPGHMVNDHVRLLRPLARGAMGDVWVARHENLNVDVAVKLIGGGLGNNDIARERFVREARCAAQLRSRHVVRIYDQGRSQDGTAYMVMELLQGTTLGVRLAEGARLTLPEVAALVRHLAAALGEAHGRGIVHRDVKPANIFMATEGGETVFKLLDFGVAKRPHNPELMTLTDAGALIGSPHYMSPEQLLNSKGVDHSCDVWALAAVTYRALVGKPPFAGDHVSDIAMAVLDASFDLPSSIDTSLPKALDQWFASALHRDRAQRFTSPESLARSFAAAIEGGPPPSLHAPSAAGATLPILDEIVEPVHHPVLHRSSRPSPDPATAQDKAGPRRWLKTERLDGDAVRQLHAVANAVNRRPQPDEDGPATRRYSRPSIDAPAPIQLTAGPPRSGHAVPVSHVRPRLLSPNDGDFVSGSYSRMEGVAARLDHPGSHAAEPSLDSPHRRRARVALWLTLAGALLLAVLLALGWWLAPQG